jgi:hypothetical protein
MHMRKVWTLGIGILLATGLVVAQDHGNDAEKTVKTTVVFTTDVRLGSTMLKAGEYQVVCDRHEISLRLVDSGAKPVKLPCKGPELNRRSDRTEVHLIQDASGVNVVQKLLLKGSNVEHTFN